MTVEPFLKATVPVAAPGDTVAVKVTGCPTLAGLAEELRLVLVGSWFTVWFRMLEVLPVKVPSPAYVAVIEWAPTVRVETARLACPEFKVEVPKGDAPS